MARWKKWVVTGCVAVGTVAALAGGTATSASATTPGSASNVCHSEVQTNVQWPLDDEYRVVAWCDSLDPNTKAQGTLDIHWAQDEHTEWFTDTGVKHYSDWRFSPFGVTPSARVDFAAV